MKKRGIGVVLSFILLIALVFTGCGGTQPQVPTNSPTSSAPASASPTGETPALSGELVVSVPAGDPFESTWKELLGQFEQKTGVVSALDAVPWGNMREKQALELASGNGAYDVVYVHPFWFGELTDNNYLVPITDYCDQATIDEFVPSLLDLYSRDGKVYGLPDWISTHILGYRTDLFKEAGLEAPKTWDDVLKAAEKFANGDEMYGITFPGKKGGALAGIFSTTLLSNGGWLRDDNDKPSINTKEAIETAEFLAKLSKYAPPGYQNNHWEESAAIASSNKAPMIMLMTSNAAWLNDPNKSQTVGLWDFVAIQNKTGGGMVDSYCWSVAESSKNRKAAEELVKFLGGTEAQIYLNQKCGTSGATHAFYANKTVTESRPEIRAMNQAFVYSKPNPAWNTWSAEQEVLEINLQSVFDGKMSASDALAEVQAKMLGN